jgi:hypothetical protein
MMRDDGMPQTEPVSPEKLAGMVRALREARQWTQETLGARLRNEGRQATLPRVAPLGDPAEGRRPSTEVV